MASERLQVILQMVAGQYKSEARQAASATGQIGKSAQFAGTQTKGMGQRMKGLATGGGGLVAMAGGAFAAKKAFDGTVGAFASFDDAMTESLAIMGDVSDAMRKDMSDAARDVAKSTTFSAEEAAESYFFLASAGLDAAASIEAMPQVAQFAQAGMFDLATATDLATDAQSALGLASEDPAQNLENLTRVTDVFVKANTLANASVEQFATSMTQKAGGALRSVGKDIEEGAATLAVFADQGIKGERAGTILRATLDGLSAKARDNAGAFAEFGIQVFDAEGNMRNMADITSDIEGALAGMTTEQREAALAQLGFNKRSREGILALDGNSDALREYEEELRNAGGTTEEVADKQLQSAAKQWELFQSQLADVGLEIGEELLPMLMELLPAIQDTASVIGSIDFSAVTAQAGPLIDALTLLNGLLGESGDEAEDASVGNQILGAAFQSVMDFANPLGAIYREIKEATEDNTEAANELTDAELAARDAFADLDPAARGAADGMYEARDAAMRARPDIGDLAGTVEDQGGAWDDVVDSMEDYEDMIRRLTDPVFRAVDDQRALEEATQRYFDVAGDSDATVGELEDAMWDLLDAQLAAEASAAELPEDMQVAADSIEIVGRRAQITEEDLRILEERIMGFDGLSAQATVGINVVGGEKIKGLNINKDIVLRQHGGPVRAGQPAIVGEDGPELWIPNTSGQVVPNQSIPQNLTSQSGFDRTVEEHHHYHLEGTGEPETDAQRVGSLASVIRRMETL